MSDEAPKLYLHKPKKAQLKKHLQQQLRSSQSPSPSPVSSSTLAIPPKLPPAQPKATQPNESFRKRYKFLWPLLLAVNISVGEPSVNDSSGNKDGTEPSDNDSSGNKTKYNNSYATNVTNMKCGTSDDCGFIITAEKPNHIKLVIYELINLDRNDIDKRIHDQLSASAYLFMRTKKKDNIEEEVAAVSPAPTSVISTASVAVVEPVKEREPISLAQQHELFKWILEEKRKLKPKDAEEKKRIDEEKAILKQFIRAKSVSSL